MKHTTMAAPKAPPLYARIRQILNLYRKLPMVAKCHALRDKFSESRMAAGPMNRKSKTALFMEKQPIRHASRGESWYPGYGLPGATREGASHGG